MFYLGRPIRSTLYIKHFSQKKKKNLSLWKKLFKALYKTIGTDKYLTFCLLLGSTEAYRYGVSSF